MLDCFVNLLEGGIIFVTTTRRSVFGCCFLVMLLGRESAFSKDGLEQDLIDALAPNPTTTRSITANDTDPKTSAADRQFLDSLPTRGISIEAREKIQDIAAASKLPRVEISLEFDYDSSKLQSSSLSTLDSLGRALSDPALREYRIMIAGYTDATGAEVYNQRLSEQRAGSVEAYLQSRFLISPNRLVVVGFGKTHLKNPLDPSGAENRRVEVVNLSAE